MTDRARFFRSSALAVAVVAACGLASCDRSGAPAAGASADALPLTTAEAAAPTRAPVADLLPAAAPAPVVRVRNPDDAYAYLDDAYYEGDAYEGAPPDYAFDYDGTTPWAWQGNDGWEFVEPVDGGYRYYYYQPGAAWPYLIRDGGYAYGFDGQQLVVVYDQGRLLPPADIDRRADIAGRYLARSAGILEASRQAGRRGVAAANWGAARAQIAAGRAQLSAERSRDSAWQAYDQAHAAQAARWNGERDRRQDYAQRFEGWRRADFQGAPPAPVGRDTTIRQAQSAPPPRAGEPPTGPSPQQRLGPPDNARVFAEQGQAGQEQERQQDDQRGFAEQRRRHDQAAEQRQTQDQARQGEQQHRFAEQQQQNQSAADQRQQADEQRRLVEQQQRAQAEQGRQQAVQQQQQHQALEEGRQADQQRRVAGQQQRQQADQQQRAQAEQARQQQAVQQQAAQQQRVAQELARRQAVQQPQQQRQAQEQARQQAAQQQHPPVQPGEPAAARPAGKEERRENKRDDKQP